MRGSILMLALAAVLFVVVLVILYPEWAKLADVGTTSGRPVAKSAAPQRATGQAQPSPAPGLQGRRQPLEKVWSYRTDHKWQYRDPFLRKPVDQTGGMVCSDIVTSQDGIYFGSEGGFIYCLSYGGKPVWSFETHGAKMGTPLIHGDRLFCGSEDNKLYALNPRSGEYIYRFDAKSEVLCTPCVANDRLIFTAQFGGVFALKPDFGKVLWTYQHDHLFKSSPAANADYAFVGADSGELLVLDAANGQLEWSYDAQSPIRSKPVISGDRLIFTCWSGKLLCLSISGRRLLYQTQLQGFIKSSPVLTGGRVFVTTLDGFVYAVSEADWQTTWSQKCGDTIEASPLISADGKKLYVGTWGGEFYVLDTATGEILASRSLGSMIPTRAAFGPDGNVLVGTKSGHVYCLAP